MPPYCLTNFKIQKYYQNKPKFDGFYWRNNLPNLYVNANNIVYFNSFGVEKFKNSQEIFIDMLQIFIEYKHMIQ